VDAIQTQFVCVLYVRNIANEGSWATTYNKNVSEAHFPRQTANHGTE